MGLLSKAREMRYYSTLDQSITHSIRKKRKEVVKLLPSVIFRSIIRAFLISLFIMHIFILIPFVSFVVILTMYHYSVITIETAEMLGHYSVVPFVNLFQSIKN